MIFSQNQNRHVFVLKSDSNVKDVYTHSHTVANLSAAGDVLVAGPTSKNELYFNYMSPGGLLRSDIIKKDNILWATSTNADDMAYKLKQIRVSLNSAATDENGKPFPGEDYILHIKVKQFVGASEESTYHKFGAVHVTKGMAVKDFYLKLAKSLATNFSRDINKFFQFGVYVTGSSSHTIGTIIPVYANSDISSSNTATYPATTANGYDYLGIVIQELSQKPEWRLGTKPFTGVNFSVYTSPVTDGNLDSVIWATDEPNGGIKKTNDDFPAASGGNLPKTVENTPVIADLEYDAMVERADVYKNVGWPYVMNTTYLVDSGNTNGYDTVDIHFYFVDSKEGAQKSEKTITFVVPKSSSAGHEHDLVNNLIGAINTQIGTSISTLS